MRMQLLRAFWNCGDGLIVEYAITRARLNRHEQEVLTMMLDDCFTQEQIAEQLHYSTRRIQQFCQSGAEKLLSIPWVKAYAESLI